MRLYELTGEFLTLQKKIEDGEQPDIAIELNAIQVKFDEKVGNCAKVIKGLEADRVAIEKEIRILQQRRDALKNTISNLKMYVLDNMQKVGVDSIQHGIFRVRAQASPVKVEVEDFDAVDEKWTRTKTEVHVAKKDLLEYFEKTGNVPDGIRFVRGKHLRIY